ncbi:MAG: hypothetical protein Q4C20_12335 [Erysipelotrichaceae bacterium]|nr:hypothetical protein [Erysipelotrichaceae bacterium]
MSKLDIEKLIYKKPTLAFGSLSLNEVLKGASTAETDDMGDDEWEPDPGTGTTGGGGF